MVDLMEIKLVCGVIGFLFIGAILGMVIGLNAPPIDEKREKQLSSVKNTN